MPEPDPAKYTPYLNLYKPDRGEAGWGPALGINFDTLDTILQGIEYTFENINVVKLGGNPISTNRGVATDGTMRVAICNDDTNLVQIELNTRSSATNLTSVAATLSAPLGVHVLDDTDQIMGISSRPVTIYNPADTEGFPIPISVTLKTASGNFLDMGKGTATSSTLRIVSADDDPGVEYLEHISTNMDLSFTPAVVSGRTINLENTLLRSVDGQLTGVVERPLWVSLSQNGAPLTLATGAGNWDSSTIRVVNATNDPNLAQINTQTAYLASTTAVSGATPPQRMLQVGRVIDTIIDGGGPATSNLYAIKGHDDGGVLTHVAGGLVGITLKDSAGTDTATKPYPLFFRNADHPDDRGQSIQKPFYTTIVDPVNIGNGVNIVELGGWPISRKRGNIEEGTQRVCIADDDTNFARINIQLNIIIEKLRWIIEHPDIKYTISASVSAGEGFITPPYAVVSGGRSATFFMMPSAGWQVNRIWRDGVLQNNNNPTQIFSNVTNDHTISVEFTELPEVTFTITSSVRSGQGTISPLGNTVVGQGSVATYTMIPSSGWIIGGIYVDNVLIASTNSVYVFTDVQANTTISVAFTTAPVETHTITATIIE